MDRARNDQERPLIKMRAALGKPFSKHCSSFMGRTLTGCVYNPVLGRCVQSFVETAKICFWGWGAGEGGSFPSRLISVEVGCTFIAEFSPEPASVPATESGS